MLQKIIDKCIILKIESGKFKEKSSLSLKIKPSTLVMLIVSLYQLLQYNHQYHDNDI